MSKARFTSFPRTASPPEFVAALVGVFRNAADQISTVRLPKGLTSDEVLAVLRDDLTGIGFEVEGGKRQDQKIKRPVFFGENGEPSLQYEIDAYQPEWRCGLEVEAGRAWMGNAVYRDLIQALIMVNVDHLVLAVPFAYKYKSQGKPITSNAYENTIAVADALYGHSRIKMPYGLTMVGY